MSDLQTYAATYQEAGFIPLPILPNSKRPACTGWQSGIAPEAFASHHGNIGVTFGPGLFVLDVDEKNGTSGMSTLHGLEAKHGELPLTLTADTPNGGRHYVFRKPESVTLRNRVSVMPGLDVRAAGSFIVAEPSQLDGRDWLWNDWQPDTGEQPEIADAPQWLLDAISKPAPEAAERATSATDGPADAYATRALERATSAVLTATEGARNDALNGAAYGLARLVAAGRLDWTQCELALVRAARATGLEDGEIRATLASAYAAGTAVPNHEGATDSGEEVELLLPVSVGDVLTNPSPPPRFVWGRYLPRALVALLAAHGGTGKSIIALMLLVAVATGRELFGIATERCRVLFASFEDDGAIVRHRLETICREWCIDPAELEGQLVVVDGTESPELFATTTARDAGSVTPTYTRLETLAEGAGLVIVDNASDTFGGDEINRRQVRAFMRSLARIAKRNDAAVLLLAHVDKNTSRAGKATNGEGYSGSTAWHNSARSRLFMVRDASGQLEIQHQKGNHAGRPHPPLLLDWPEDGLPQLSHARPGPAAADSGLLAELDTRALLALIAEFSERGEHVTTATTSRTHAAKLLASEPTFPKSRKVAEIFTLLREAERKGHLARVNVTMENRKQKEVWDVTAEGREFAGLAPTAPTAPTSQVDALDAEGAEGAPTAPTSERGL